LDIELPEINGLDLTRKFSQLPKPVPVLLLTMHKEETLFNEAMDRGAQGFLLKENAVSELISGIKAVARGEIFLSPSVSHFLLQRHQRQKSFEGRHPQLADLTPMERRVLKLTGENLTCREIGKELFISHRTVQTHRNNMAQKLNLHGSHKLLQFAIEHRAEL
jgi:DNA-binding NarL/FixJ family response regulator